MSKKDKTKKFYGLGGASAAEEPVPHEGTPEKNESFDTGSIVPMIAASRNLQRDQSEFAGHNREHAIVNPPYDPWILVCLVEESSILPQMIDIMATNISGYGYELVPNYMTHDQEGNPLEPPAEVEAERSLALEFLETANLEDGLLGVLDKADRDREVTGNSYTEVLRDPKGRIRALSHLRSYRMRLGKLSEPVKITVPFRTSTGKQIQVPRLRRFRTFVQNRDGKVRYFKEFGDPRHLNMKTGTYSLNPIEPNKNGTSNTATEVIHRAIYSTYSDYGIPRWVGGVTHVKASRQASELIVDWFTHAPIGAKIALVSGGAFVEDSLNTALAEIDDMARGSKNAFSLITLTSESSEAGGGGLLNDTRPVAPSVSFEDLAYELPNEIYSGDGNLIDGSMDRIGRMFRLPPVYWGASDDYSRAAVQTARATTEEQVFRPIRAQVWERLFNHHILPLIGVTSWKFKLLGANTTDDAEIAAHVKDFEAAVGPNAIIRLWNKITGQELETITEEWGDRPIALTMALLQSGIDPNATLEEAAEALANATPSIPVDQQEAAEKALKVVKALAHAEEMASWLC